MLASLRPPRCMDLRGNRRTKASVAGNHRRDVADANARATGLRDAIFSWTGGILRESGVRSRKSGETSTEDANSGRAPLPDLRPAGRGFLESLDRAVHRHGAGADDALAAGAGREALPGHPFSPWPSRAVPGGGLRRDRGTLAPRAHRPRR